MAKVISKKIIDTTIPLENEQHEMFCIYYIQLDVEQGVSNKKARRELAYRKAFPENTTTPKHIISSRASALMRKEEVQERLDFLYEDEGTAVEMRHEWNVNKAMTELRAMAHSETVKPADKLKALEMLNKMAGIDKPMVEEEEETADAVTSFLDKLLNK